MNVKLAGHVIIAGILLCTCYSDEDSSGITFIWFGSSSKMINNSNAAGLAFYFRYPELQQIEGTDSAQKWIAFQLSHHFDYTKLKENILANMDQMLAERRNLQAEFDRVPNPWFYRSDVRIIFRSSKTISYQIDHEEYLGGAHANHQRLLKSFDVGSGFQIALDSLVNVDSLNALADRLFRRQINIPEGSSLEKYGYWFPDNQFVLNRNFVVKENGLLFYFNPYEIAPYSMGADSLFLPFNKIRRLIKNDLLF